jgi:tRNA G37 N-methylase TrmD
MDEAIARYPEEHRRSAAMPLLHLWQEHFGFISDNGGLWIAAKLGLQPINILELVTFYPMFRQKPAGKTHIRVCRTLSCAMAGSYQLMENLCATTGIERRGHGDGMHNPISVSADGNYSIEFVECLASCGTAPVCMIGEELRENVDVKSIADLLRNQTSNPPEDGFAAANIKPQTSKVVLMSPAGRRFDQQIAAQLSGESHLIIICGHYEGVDHRVIEHLVDLEISIGDYVLTNGAIAAVVLVDAVVRLMPGVLGHEQSAADDSFSRGLLEAPQYTRPAEFRGWKVPDVLLSGNHAEIEKWRKKEALRRTRENRPDLLE